MTETIPPIAVLGATGQQGRAVVGSLLRSGAPTRALVRNVHSPAADALRADGVEVVAADQEDPTSLRSGLRDVSALFFMTTFADSSGTAGEVRRGTAVAEAAAAAAVPRVVYSSVGGAERRTGIPHFESKRRVEERLRDLVPATFLRPTFFMENLAPQLTGPGDAVIRMPMPGDVPLQMVSVRDIGAAAAEVWEKDVRYEALPLDVLGDDADLRAMFAWFAAPPAYQADLARTRELVPDVRDTRTWLRTIDARSGAPLS